jgi:UDP-2,3-diacylglucosamine pyrophosphatase LpxH
MQIAILSDLHLGRKDSLDQFSRNPGAEETLYLLLKNLETSVDKIILLGDIFETLRGRTLNAEKELREVLKMYPIITKKIMDDDRYILISGNHDAVTSKVLQAPDWVRLKDHGTSISFFHGHQLDPFVEGFWTNNFEKIGVWLGGWLERAGIDITKKGNISSKLKALANQWKVGKFERLAAAMGEDLKSDLVVTGHSHHPMKVEFGNTLFLNSGTRVAARQDMIILDTSSQEYEVYKKYQP